MTNHELVVIILIIAGLLMLGLGLACWWAFHDYDKPKGGNHDH